MEVALPPLDDIEDGFPGEITDKMIGEDLLSVDRNFEIMMDESSLCFQFDSCVCLLLILYSY